MSESKKNITIRLANWLATKLIKDTFLEELIGDLDEIYEERKITRGTTHALLMYCIDTIHLLFGFSSLIKFKTQNKNIIMIKYMFKIAWRNANRQKQFTVLNLLGLTIGITVSLLLGTYVHHEINYDNFHVKKDRIYRINQPNIWGDWNEISSSTGPNVATALKEDAPDFEEVTRLLSMGSQIVRSQTDTGSFKLFEEEGFLIAEANFLDVFTFNLLEGDKETALDEPLNMLLTKETAEKYFGYEDPMGETIQVKQWDGKWKTYTVKGILANIPSQSHIQFDILVSLASYPENMEMHGWKWIWTAFSTYGLVKEGTDIASLTEKIQAIPAKWAPPTTKRIFNQTFEEFTAGNPWFLNLQPLPDIYLAEHPFFNQFGPEGNINFIRLFIVLGILVLLISCINFMNLSTAKSSTRGKEIGVRKVLGSGQKSLILQFIFESILYVAASTIAALIIVYYSLDIFNNISEKELSITTYLTNPIFTGILLLFIVGLGIVAGSYPAFYLSSFRPIDTLKGKISNGLKGKGLRNGLVIFQFTISITLIICTFFVQKQLSHTSTMDLGYVKENILQIHNIEQFGLDTELLKTKLASNPKFSAIGQSFGVPPSIWSGDRYKSDIPNSQVVQISNLRTEEDYLNLLGVEIIEGRNFDPNKSNDKYGVILNEKAVQLLGWDIKNRDDSPIGKNVSMASGSEDKFEVIGVVKDFNFNSVRNEIQPLIVINNLNDKVWDYGHGLSFISMRINSESINSALELQLLIEEVEGVLNKIDPTIPFTYSFMDQDFEKTFREERRMSTVLNIFTLMGLIIACLGLFGLAAFSAEQRTKELGIRKVLGANISQIIVLFSSEFIKLVGISIIIASPIAFYFVDDWLNNFAYKTTINFWVFFLAAGGALSIALLTIGYQSMVAALKNPVDSLKSE